MHSAWLRSTFLWLLEFLEVEEGVPNYLGKAILKNVWIICSPLLHFNFKSFKYRICSSFIRFQWILDDSGVLFSEFSNFYKLKRGVLISVGNQFCRMSELFGSPLLYFNLTSFLYPNSSSFIRLHCIPHDSRAVFSKSSNFYKLKRGEGGVQFLGERIFHKVWVI